MSLFHWLFIIAASTEKGASNEHTFLFLYHLLFSILCQRSVCVGIRKMWAKLKKPVVLFKCSLYEKKKKNPKAPGDYSGICKNVVEIHTIGVCFFNYK